jgi:hypothetical protein
MRDAGPAESGPAVPTVKRADKNAECWEPGGRKNQVHRPAEEAAGEGEKPKQAEEDGDSGNRLRVDESFFRPSIYLVEVMKVGSDDTGDDLESVILCSIEARWELTLANMSSPVLSARDVRRDMIGILTDDSFWWTFERYFEYGVSDFVRVR